MNISLLKPKSDECEDYAIQFLTKGHTHMSAEGIRGNIKKK